jgi:hypothetical protein
MRVVQVTDGEFSAIASTLRRRELVEPAVVVTTADGSQVDVPESLPCIVVGLGHDADAPPPHVDLVIEPEVCALDDVLATVDANPLASTALALLLRAAPYRSVEAGLVAESSVYSMLQGGPEFTNWREHTPRRERPAEHDPAVRICRRDTTLEVVLSRPHVRNALNRAMRDGLLDAVVVAAADPALSVEVRGDGPVFCSGGDLDEFSTFDDPVSAHLVRLATSIGLAIASIADRVTVRVHGPCAGSGVELPAFAGTVVAHPETTFALPEISLGLIPGAGGTVSLTRRAGRHRVALLALSGRSLDATTARRWGLVDVIDG